MNRVSLHRLLGYGANTSPDAFSCRVTVLKSSDAANKDGNNGDTLAGGDKEVKAIYQPGSRHHLISPRLAQRLSSRKEFKVEWESSLLRYRYRTCHVMAQGPWGDFDILFGDSWDGEDANSCQPSPFQRALKDRKLVRVDRLDGLDPIWENKEGQEGSAGDPCGSPNYVKVLGNDKPPDSTAATAATTTTPASETTESSGETTKQGLAAMPFLCEEHSGEKHQHHDGQVDQFDQSDSDDSEFEFSESYWTWSTESENWFHKDPDGEVVWYPREFD